MNVGGFLDRIASGQVLVADGATGTNLQARGLAAGRPGEMWVFERPDEIKRLHSDFIAAGADIILTCTFGGTSIRLAQEGLCERAAEVNKRATSLAREAVQGTQVLVAGSLGPTGQMLKPLGTLEEKDCYQSYAEQVVSLDAAGVDFLLIETQFDLVEASLAVEAVRDLSALPLVCSFSYDRGTRTMMGVRPSKMAQSISNLGVDVLGINCGRSLQDNLDALKELRDATDLPIWFKPNAGLPTIDENGQAVYDVTPQDMGTLVADWIAAGASVVGGCCGSTPEHIRQIAQAVKG